VFVVARPGEDFESLLRRFTRGVQNTGLLREYRKKQRFTPAHEQRRDKIRAAGKRAAKRAQMGG
jgi:small subunit ribosomal protein S21